MEQGRPVGVVDDVFPGSVRLTADDLGDALVDLMAVALDSPKPSATVALARAGRSTGAVSEVVRGPVALVGFRS